MSFFINPKETNTFFQDFYSKVLEPASAIASDITKYRILNTSQGFGLEEKSSSGLSYSLEKILAKANIHLRHVYHFEKTLQTLALLAERTIPQEGTFEQGHEALAASKTFLVLKQFFGPMIKKHQDSQEMYRAELRTLEARSRTLFLKAAELLQVTPLALACVNKMDAMCVALMKGGASLDEVQDHATYLLNLRKTYRFDTNIVFSLIELGADIQQAEVPDLEAYLMLSLIANPANETVACRLIEAGAKTGELVSGYRYTARQTTALRNLVAPLKSMMAKGVDMNTCDSQGNTLLHFACQHYSKDVIAFLSTLVDCTRMNDEQKRPFALFSSTRRNHFLEHTGSTNPLEMFFLLQDIASAKQKAQSLSYSEFLSHLEDLSKKYPKTPLGALEFCYLEISPTHYQKGSRVEHIPPPPETIRLSTLLELFDQINFTDDSSPDFQNPATLIRDTRTDSLEDLKELLRTFISRIEQRTAFQGTPDAGSSALEDFYRTIEYAVKNCIYTLQKNPNKSMQDKTLQDKTLLEFIRAASNCGGRYYNTAVCQFQKVCRGKTPTFEEELYQLLAEFREILFHSGIDQNDSHNVNSYNFLIRKLGTQYGLPGSEALASFEDPYGFVNVQESENRFLQLYTPCAIIRDWLEQHLKDSGEFRERFIDWQKANVPQEWQKEHFDTIITEVRRLEQANEPKEHIIRYLESKDILLSSPRQTPLQAIENERQYAFLGSEVFDMTTGKIKITSVVHLLKKLGVVSSIYEQAEPAKPLASYLAEHVGSWFTRVRAFFGH